MTTKEELIKIHNRYKQNVDDYRHMNNMYNTYLNEYDKVRNIDCITVENLRIKVCEILGKRLKLLDSYMDDERILQGARNEQTEEYYKMCFTYQRIGFLTKQEYDMLIQADRDIDSITIEECIHLKKLIQDNYAAYYIAPTYLSEKLHMRLNTTSKKSHRWF